MKIRASLLLAILSLVGCTAISQEVAASVDRSAEYMAEINYADRIFENKNYQLARSAYEKIYLDYKDLYSRYKNLEIERILDGSNNDMQSEINYQYAKMIIAADDQFNKGNYENATQLYKQGISIKPTEQFPYQRLEELKHYR
ncbi:MAG: hypothetical protein ACI837_001058 [Crocinitomicaceae bacterium]|jgi:hypothetical protein